MRALSRVMSKPSNLVLTLSAERTLIVSARCTERGETRTLAYWPGGNLDTAVSALDPFQRKGCDLPLSMSRRAIEAYRLNVECL